MEYHEWLVFSCRACRGVIKLSPGMATGSVICPRCRTKVSVPKDAPVVKEEVTHNQIPAARNTDEKFMSQIRGPGREEWEVGHRPTGGDLDFRQRLHTTSEPELKSDPDKPSMKRVNMRRRKHEQTHEDFDDPEERHLKRRRRARTSHGTLFARTFVKGLIAAVVLLAGVAGWLAWKRWNETAPAADKESEWRQEEPIVPDEAPDGPRLENRNFAAYRPALAAVVRKFASAATVEEILPLVRDRERVEKKIRAYYTAERPWRPIEINNKFEASEDSKVEVDGDFITLKLLLANYEEIPISLERTGDTFLVDWECFTGYGDLTWEELKQKRPVSPVLMRVVIEKGPSFEYWNGPFSDHTTHNCYRLSDLKSQHHLSGYTVKDSPVDVKIRQFLMPVPGARGMYHLPAVIMLKYPPGSQGAQQVEIVDWVAKGWVFRPKK